MYLLINGKVEHVGITNSEPDGYTFVEDTTYYKRFRKTGCDDMLVFKVDDIEELKEFLTIRSNQESLKIRYNFENPQTLTNKIENFFKTLFRY